VTSSVSVFEAATWVIINVYDKIMTENQKKNNVEIKNFLNKSQSL